MANPEHLQILKQGVAAWNAWRDQHRDITPDLTEVHLTHAHLFEANLTGTNFSKANLLAANLAGSTLTGATLTGAILAKALLSCADLTRANLLGADLTDAICTQTVFIEADLRGADLTRASLDEANLSRAVLHETVFGHTLLVETLGLETCIYEGPSTLDFRTLAPAWPLPLEFLRGCGLPETLIEYFPSIVGEPYQFYSCFISYASQDQAFAERLHADLQNKGVRCWFAPKDLSIGAKIRARIDETIRPYDKRLLVLSKASVMSQWVEQEVATGLMKKHFIQPP